MTVLPPDEAGEEAGEILCLLAAQSPALCRELYREPRLLAELAADPWLRREKDPALYLRQCAEAVRPGSGEVNLDVDVGAALRRFRNREYLRLGARELGYGSAREVARELSALASACTELALEVSTGYAGVRSDRQESKYRRDPGTRDRPCT